MQDKKKKDKKQFEQRRTQMKKNRAPAKQQQQQQREILHKQWAKFMQTESSLYYLALIICFNGTSLITLPAKGLCLDRLSVELFRLHVN